jgi:hypothetical protein
LEGESLAGLQDDWTVANDQLEAALQTGLMF